MKLLLVQVVLNLIQLPVLLYADRRVLSIEYFPLYGQVEYSLQKLQVSPSAEIVVGSSDKLPHSFESL